MKKIGFVDYYLDEYHANHYPDWIKNFSGGELEVAYAWAKKDAPSGVTTQAWCKEHHIEQTATIQELVEKSDYIVVLSPDNPEMHEELCEAPLSSGKRVYVDKTFADDRAAALRIFTNAEKHGTPCFSASALRFASEYASICKEKIQSLASWSPGSFDVYSIHQIEPIVMLMGSDAKRVMYIGTEIWPALVIEFFDGRRAVMSHHGYNCPFSMAINLDDGTSEMVQVRSDYFSLFVEQMVNFFLTGDQKVSHADTIAVISIREAGLKAAKTPDVWVNIE